MSDACEHVYISSLPAELDDAKLHEVFAAYGNISRAVLLPQTGINSKRAGIITFGTVDEAKWIVENLNGNIPQGLTEAIEVKYKQHKDKGKGGGKPDYSSQQAYTTPGGGYGKADNSWQAPSWPPAGQGGNPAGDSVFFADLPPNTDEARLQEIFGAYGTIKFSKMCGAGKEGKLSAIVNFGSVDEAKWIVENLNGNIPQGLQEPIKASYKIQKGKGDDGKGKGPPGPYGKGPPVADWGGSKGGGFVDAGKGKGKDCGIRVLVRGLFDSGAMPGTQKWPVEGNALFVGGLPHDTTDLDLYKIFSVFGALLPDGAKAMPGDDGAACKGIGFVNFADPAIASTAITTLNGTQMPDGRTLKVSLKQSKGAAAAGKGKDAGAAAPGQQWNGGW